MNDDEMYYEPGYDDFNAEPYGLIEEDAESALASIGWGLDESYGYNPLREF